MSEAMVGMLGGPGAVLAALAVVALFAWAALLVWAFSRGMKR